MRLWLAILLVSTPACGGESQGESADTTANARAAACADSPLAGSPEVTKGLYDLRIETLSDDCSPPLVRGEVGLSVVYTATEVSPATANIPVYFDAIDPSFSPSRSDVPLDESLVVELPLNTAPPCSAASTRSEFSAPLVSPTELDIEFQWSIAGTDTCEEPPPRTDCTSDRVFHFRWLCACPADDQPQVSLRPGSGMQPAAGAREHQGA